MSFEIIDFHTHPFIERENNICNHIDSCDMSVQNTKKLFDSLSVSKICGSVVCGHHPEDKCVWDKVKRNNDTALKLREMYGDFYIPGFHVHPGFIEESIEEIHRMHSLGVNLIGEIVPYIDLWNNYARPEFSLLLDEAEKYGMVVSLHSVEEEEDEMDELVRNHKNLTIVAAHPGEYHTFMRHLERMKISENYYLDLSGYGMFRHGMLRYGIDKFGAERFIFGSDYPTCNPGMYIGGVLLDTLITDTEKEKIFSLNARRLLGLN